jgi:cell division protein FtsQ
LAAKFGLTASAAYLCLVMVYSASLNGSIGGLPDAVDDAVNAIGVSAGFPIERVAIQGRVHTTEAEIYAALAAKGRSMLTFDTGAALDRLRRAGWVKTAEIQRLWPSALSVRIEERQPAAIWRDGIGVKVVDTEGAAVVSAAPDAFPQLLRIAGDDAPSAAQELRAALETHKEIKALLVRAERIAGRRWDLVMSGDTRVKLPERGFQDALSQLDQLLAGQSGLLAHLAVLDLRSPAHIALHLKNNTKEARQQVLSSLPLALRQSGL